MSLPEVGSVAPDFTLPSTSGESVTLSTFRGHRSVLLAFFPLAFTSTCTAELCAFSDDYDEFERAGNAVLPISVDSVPALKAYRAQAEIGVELLSDFLHAVSRSYGVFLESKNHSARAYILIDREGTVRWTWVEARLGLRRENDELLQQLAALA
ncbi:MAG: redoxin domain-containing protein [Gemmatimonadota bacterium]